MTISRFEPWTLIDLLHRDLGRVGGRRFGDPGVGTENPVADWLPAVDVVEENERFVLRADLPGVSPDDIEVNMDDGVLSLSGTRTAESGSDTDGLKRIERVTGKFHRRFNLPDTADAEAISARSANGILEISIPKQPQVHARRITVQAA